MKLNLRSLAIVGLATFALSTAGCGAKQRGAVRLNTEFETAYQAVPTDAAFSIGVRMTDDDRQEMPTAAEISSALMTMGLGGGWLTSALDLSNLSDAAFFVHETGIWIVLAQDDPAAVLDQLRSAGDVEERSLGRASVLRQTSPYSDETQDVAVIGHHVVVRVGPPASEEDVDVALARMAQRWPGTGTLADSARYNTVAARLGDRELSAVFSVDTAGISATLDAVRGSSLDAGGLLSGLGDGGVDADECDQLNARIINNFPGLIGITARGADGAQRYEGQITLNGDAHARARQVFPGAVSLSGLQQDVLFGGGFSFDFGAFVSSMQAEPKHKGCAGIAGLAGALAETARDLSSEIQFNRRTVSGTVGFVLQDVDFSGFVPTFSAALVVHSPAATALLDRVVRFLNTQGSGDVVEDTSVPTLQYNLNALPMRVRVMQGADRVVIAFGSVREPVQLALLNSAMRQEGAPFFDMFVSGARIRALVDELDLYLREMEVVSADELEQGQGLFDAIRRVTDANVRSVHTEEGIRTTGDVAAPGPTP